MGTLEKVKLAKKILEGGGTLDDLILAIDSQTNYNCKYGLPRCNCASPPPSPPSSPSPTPNAQRHDLTLAG